ncbi:hypothetical protein HanRHA438_Chr11g0525601 [Helianthus annuus]|nr:hypothetical protein HanRHA438_Chr11g0525601 [Helianthus annuus]
MWSTKREYKEHCYILSFIYLHTGTWKEYYFLHLSTLITNFTVLGSIWYTQAVLVLRTYVLICTTSNFYSIMRYSFFKLPMTSQAQLVGGLEFFLEDSSSNLICCKKRSEALLGSDRRPRVRSLSQTSLPVILPSCLRAGGLSGFPQNWWWMTRVTLRVLRLSSGFPESSQN